MLNSIVVGLLVSACGMACASLAVYLTPKPVVKDSCVRGVARGKGGKFVKATA